MPESEARLRASANYFKRREEAGLKRVTIWMEPDTRSELEALRDRFGSKDAAVAEAIRRLTKDILG